VSREEIDVCGAMSCDEEPEAEVAVVILLMLMVIDADDGIVAAGAAEAGRGIGAGEAVFRGGRKNCPNPLLAFSATGEMTEVGGAGVFVRLVGADRAISSFCPSLSLILSLST